NIPAYVSPIYNMYLDVAEKVKDQGVTVEQLSKMTNNHTYVITTAVNAKSKDINYYIDVLGQFGGDAWKELAKQCPSIADYINELGDHAMQINSFLGLNIADLPTIPFIGGAALTLSVLIPVLSVITQIISMKLSMASQPAMDPNNPTAASMKTMNNVMPFVSGAMCFMFPIGVGIYWVAGNVFRIFQTLLINMYFKRLDMDDMIANNIEKSKARYERMGIDPNKVFSDVSKQKTSNIDVKKNTNKSKKETASQKANKRAADVNYKGNTNKKYKEGSIAAYANMMARDRESENKKK
ncbi:MAG: YidC/Oxa1 family membrane protein insertase, partial [Lachnospiraceae bacterium]|nr:YidC/Oxa1 family membrane protein insertase [Lachnospiraceae bacterium]